MYFHALQSPDANRRYPKPSSTLEKAKLDRDMVQTELQPWQFRTISKLTAKIEIILLFILGVLGLAAAGYGIEGLASFVNDHAMAHAVTALLR